VDAPVGARGRCHHEDGHRERGHEARSAEGTCGPSTRRAPGTASRATTVGGLARARRLPASRSVGHTL
jgi:hypothetical protein